MDKKEAYEWLAPKLSDAERKALDIIYESRSGWISVKERLPELIKQIERVREIHQMHICACCACGGEEVLVMNKRGDNDK